MQIIYQANGKNETGGCKQRDEFGLVFTEGLADVIIKKENRQNCGECGNYKNNSPYARDGGSMNFSRAWSINQMILLCQPRYDWYKEHYHQCCAKVNCHIGFHLLT